MSLENAPPIWSVSCFFSFGNIKMTRNYSICMSNWIWSTSDPLKSFNEASCVLAQRALLWPWFGDDSILTALCFVPSSPNFTCHVHIRLRALCESQSVTVAGGSSLVENNCVVGFPVWKDVCDQQKIKIKLPFVSTI